MKFGYILPNYGDKISPRELIEISEVCEEVGFDSVWATDHVVMPVELREPYGQLLEPLMTLAYVASGCEKLKVGTSCIVLPQRNPVLVAKQAAALDAFSGGRVVLGVGAGWTEKEFGFLNADFGRRGKIFDESLKVMRALWSDEVVNFEGDFFHLKDALFFPKPVAKTIPLWIGGSSPRSVRRAIELGDGWHPVGVTPEEFREGAERARTSGRDLTLSLRMTVDVRKRREPTTTPTGGRRVAVSGSASEVRAGIDAYEKQGLDYFCASINHPAASDVIADLRRFSSEVIGSYGRASG